MITTSNNVQKVRQDWKRLRKAYRKTIASALSSTAYTIAKERMPAIMAADVDRPTRFTQNSGRYKKATPARLVAVVALKDIQAKYMQRNVYGGRTDKGKAVPVKIRLNKFGNIASLKDGRKIQTLLAKPGHFSATINGTSGIWKRTGNGLDLLIVFSEGAYRYRRRSRWHAMVNKEASKILPIKLRRSIDKTIRREALRTKNAM